MAQLATTTAQTIAAKIHNWSAAVPPRSEKKPALVIDPFDDRIPRKKNPRADKSGDAGPSLGLHKGAGFAPAVTPQFTSVRSHKKGAHAVRSGATARSPTRIFWTDAGAKHFARAPTCSHTFSVRHVPNSPDAIYGNGQDPARIGGVDRAILQFAR